MKQKIGRCERLIRFIGREVGGPVLPPTRKRNDQAYNQNSRGVLGRGGWPGGSPWILGTGFWGVAIRESLEYNGESSAPLSTFWGGFVHRGGSVPQSQCGWERAGLPDTVVLHGSSGEFPSGTRCCGQGLGGCIETRLAGQGLTSRNSC